MTPVRQAGFLVVARLFYEENRLLSTYLNYSSHSYWRPHGVFGFVNLRARKVSRFFLFF